jgi:hypothetical protein
MRKMGRWGGGENVPSSCYFVINNRLDTAVLLSTHEIDVPLTDSYPHLHIQSPGSFSSYSCTYSHTSNIYTIYRYSQQQTTITGRTNWGGMYVRTKIDRSPRYSRTRQD